MRILNLMALAVSLASIAQGQTDWPTIGHEGGAPRYSPLKQINSKNVAKLQLAWSFDTEAPVVDPPGRGRRGGDAAADGGGGRGAPDGPPDAAAGAAPAAG